MFAVELDPATGEVVISTSASCERGRVLRYRTADEVSRAITEMVVRGAPAIGIAAAYALVLQARSCRGDLRAFLLENGAASKHLNRARPTAVNLAWAIARMGKRAAEVAALAPDERAAAMQAEAEAIHIEDVAACRAMGRIGAEHIKPGSTVLTHCNAGALATGGYGTALGVIRAAHEQGKNIASGDGRGPTCRAPAHAFDSRRRHPVEVITDSMAGYFFQKGEIDFVVVGSDRIAATATWPTRSDLRVGVSHTPTTCRSPWRLRSAPWTCTVQAAIRSRSRSAPATRSRSWEAPSSWRMGSHVGIQPST